MGKTRQKKRVEAQPLPVLLKQDFKRGGLFDGEAVGEARAAGGDQRLLAAALRAVRRVPAARLDRFRETVPVMMTHQRGAVVAALGPVATGSVAAGSRSASVGHR